MTEFFEYEDRDMDAHYSYEANPVPSDFAMHAHEEYEFYCFFGGEGIYRVEGTPYPLERGDIIIVRPAEAHYVDIMGIKPYTRFCVHFKEELFASIDPSGRLLRPFNNRKIGTSNRYRAEDFSGDAYKAFIKNITMDSPDRRVHVLTNLLPILNEISMVFETTKKPETSNALENEIVSYINRHISDELTLDNICNKFYISKTHLCRLFKKATASTVGDYITAKRLMKAKQLLASGVPPTKAYLQCGFNDYSVFYRAYKRKYASAPSKPLP